MSDPDVARELAESDPNGSGPEGLAGGMGVSSERTGRVRGTPGDVSNGTEDTSVDGETDDRADNRADDRSDHPVDEDSLPG